MTEHQKSDNTPAAVRRPYSEAELLETSTRLHKRFLIWGVAVVTTMTSSGLVALRPAEAWAQEESSSNSPATPDSEFSARNVQSAIQAGEFEKAAEMVDAALQADVKPAGVESLDQMLAMRMLRSNQEKALARMQRQFKRLVSSDKLSLSEATALATSAYYQTAINKDLNAEQKLSLFDAAIEKLETADPVSALPMLNMTRQRKASLLASEEREEEAKSLFDQIIADARKKIDQDNPATISSFVNSISTFASTLGDSYPDQSEALKKEASELALSLLESDNPKASDFSTYYNLKSREASQLAYSEPEKAAKIYEEIQAKLTQFKERLDEDQQALMRYEGMLKSGMARLESALKRAELVGQPAPEFDASYFVAMEETSLDQLKGKVVLLDFWAVWCGPCIATFPHLREWHEEFSDDGLVIIGATKFYNYAWDKDAGKAVRAEEEVPAEAELAMLEKFRESYDLHHGFMVSSAESTFSKDYFVSGIPQAVLIDQEGKVAMIRVGSGEANAKALEDKIQELLN